MRVHELDISNHHHPSLTIRFMNTMQFSHFAPLETICYWIIDQHNLWNYNWQVYKAGGRNVSFGAMQNCSTGTQLQQQPVCRGLHTLISYYLPTTQWVNSFAYPTHFSNFAVNSQLKVSFICAEMLPLLNPLQNMRCQKLS